MLLGIIGILAWGVGFIPQNAWAWLEKDDNLVEAIWTSGIAYAKPLKIAWGAWNWTLDSNKCNQTKEMDAISKYHDLKFSHGWYVCILFKNYIFTLFTSFNRNLICFNFFCVRFRGTTKEGIADAIWLALTIHQLFIHHHATKIIIATTNNHTNMGIAFSLSIVMTFLVRECYGSPKKHENSLKFVKICVEECFDKVLYHINSRILKCKMKNVITMILSSSDE
jgi:hypothetical protein